MSTVTVPEGSLITPEAIGVQRAPSRPVNPNETPLPRGHSVSPDHNLTPQTMCPAFGSLRVLTRIDGVQTAMVTDTGCLYGLTFVTHFYAARKSIAAPAFGTKELVAGNVAEAAIAACVEASKVPGTKLIAAISLCVAETAGLTEEMLPPQINGIDVILVRVPAYAIHSHPEAKDVAINAILKRYAPPRMETTAEGVEKPLTYDGSNAEEEALRRKVIMLGELFPADPISVDTVLKRLGSGLAATLPSRNLDDYKLARRVGAIAAVHPFYGGSVATLRAAGVPIITGAPVGPEASYNWIKAVGAALKLDPALTEQVATEEREKCRAILQQFSLQGRRILVCGYEGNELLYARLLVEAGAEVPYISTSIQKSLYTAPDEAWLKARGTREIVYQKTLEQDIRALDVYKPDLVLGTTPLSAEAKQRGIPAMYYTNMLSVRPLFLSAGLAGTIQLIQEALGRAPRYEWMREFFEGPRAAAPQMAPTNTLD
ncbi:MAG: chlorophyllide a reductase subunit Y [Anaerolineae bacterium]|nr:chlorophyllide a reductase subunit Y [Thermoflexales bacterium]MCX7938652.1 chlorophyllide a reductase subunit Y [Thermoflexales bacterium]MDW8292111.1 chlorophyllide a reductase subunit Y [Anaerolineae bacterium]